MSAELLVASGEFLRLDPEGARAAQGLLDIAERILTERGKPEAAHRVYAFLFKHCPQLLFATAIREGLERCERETQQVPAASRG